MASLERTSVLYRSPVLPAERTADEDLQQTEQPPAKRMKRGKYTSKACTYCQKRKIKCDGEYPCGQCSSKGQNCMRPKGPQDQRMTASGDNVKNRSSGTTSQHPLAADDQGPGDLQLNELLLQRLNRLESQLQSLTARTSKGSFAQSPHEEDVPGPQPHSGTEIDNTRTRGPAEYPVEQADASNADVPPYSGETSMAHSLNQVEGHLELLGVTRRGDSHRPLSQPLTPRPQTAPYGGGVNSSRSNYFEGILDSHGIMLNRSQCDRCLQTFADEVHVLYPFLHLPTIWENHKRFWCSSSRQSAGDSSYRRERQLEIVRVLLCLALGRCTGGSRAATVEGRHSAGWSLYTAAMELFGEPIEGLAKGGSALLRLQTLALMVVYLFRLDANERASKILAIAISHCYYLGLHRQEAVSRMAVYESEQFRRLWWCVYVLDRRLALETGLPFVIQDVNISTALPTAVGDDWLSKFKHSPQTAEELLPGIQLELSSSSVTPIPYLVAMVQYSRVLGKVWEKLYGARTVDIVSDQLINEYFECLVADVEAQTPPSLVYNPGDTLEIPTGASSWWQIKQKMLIQIRWAYLRLAVRKPMLQRSLSAASINNTNNLENEVVCIHLARRIFDLFNRIPDDYPKMEFPFSVYLARTAVIAVGLIIKRPSFKGEHGAATLHIARMLKRHCGQTWVSGKFLRSMLRLNHMAETILGMTIRQGPINKNSIATNSSTFAGSGHPFCTAQRGERGDHLSPPAGSHAGRTPTGEAEFPDRENIMLSYVSTSPPQDQPDAAHSTASSGLLDLVTADFDFEQAINVSGFEDLWPQPQTNRMPSLEDPTVFNVPTPGVGGNGAIDGAMGSGTTSSEQVQIGGPSRQDAYGLNGVNDFPLGAEWVQDLLGSGLDLEAPIYW